jgi:hypothetical protein
MTHDPGGNEHQIVLLLTELTQARMVKWALDRRLSNREHTVAAAATAGMKFKLSWAHDYYNPYNWLTIQHGEGEDTIESGTHGGFNSVVSQGLNDLVDAAIATSDEWREQKLDEVLDALDRLNESKRVPWWRKLFGGARSNRASRSEGNTEHGEV